MKRILAWIICTIMLVLNLIIGIPGFILGIVWQLIEDGFASGYRFTPDNLQKWEKKKK